MGIIKFILSKLKGDKVIWFIFFFLMIISVIEVFSASYSLVYAGKFKGDYAGPITAHVLFCFLGGFFAFAIHMFDVRRPLYKCGFFCMLLLLVILVFTSLTGARVNGASRWFLGFQPSEVAKLFYAAALARFYHEIYLVQNEPDAERKRVTDRNILWVLGLTGALCFLIFLENFSTALIVGGAGFLTMIVCGYRLKFILSSVGVVALIVLLLTAGVALKILPPIGRMGTVVARIERKFAPSESKDSDKIVITAENFQEVHGKIAIANSYGIGRGFGRSREKDVLPQAYSDFIFAIIIEETGLLGGFIVILLYVVFLYRVGRLLAQCKNQFSAVFSVCIGLMLVIQAIVNMSVAVGLFPVTGQNLPLVSRGGSSIIVTSIIFGVILSISNFESEDVRKEAEKNAEKVEV